MMDIIQILFLVARVFGGCDGSTGVDYYVHGMWSFNVYSKDHGLDCVANARSHEGPFKRVAQT